MQKEIWKKLYLVGRCKKTSITLDLATNYEISNLGRVRNVRFPAKPKPTQTIQTGKYNMVDIFYGGKAKRFRVDRLVAKTYGLPRISGQKIVNHINGINTDDRFNNLQWLTQNAFIQQQYSDETWKPVSIDTGKNQLYYVSDKGNVWSANIEDNVKQRVISGYMSVQLRSGKNAKFVHVHRLVAMAFCDNLLNKKIVNHKDLNKMNNNATNLEWVTQSENVQHAIDNICVKSKRTVLEYCDPPKDYAIHKMYPTYLITKMGTVYSTISKRYMCQCINNNGYKRVNVTDKNKKSRHVYVHILVADVYLIKPTNSNNYQVNHKNKNRLDNRIENLEWVTQSENIKHRNIGKSFAHIQKKVNQIDCDTETVIKIHDGIKAASRNTGVNSGSIVAVCKGRKKTAGGYKWEYA